MVRAPCYDKMGLKKGEWSPEEDQKLIAYIRRYGIWNWREMPKPAGLLRSGKSCRLRWMNYLRPDIKHGNFSKKEEEIILKLHDLLGNRWSAIAARLPGRTDNEIKNYWHTQLKRRVKKDDQAQRTKSEVTEKASNNEASQNKSYEITNLLLPITMEASKLKGSREIPLSPQFSTAAFASSTTNPIIAINEIEKASNFEATEKLANYKERVSETDLLLPIVLESSKLNGSKDNIPVSPQLSTGDFSSSSTDPIFAINEIDTSVGQHIGSLETFGQLQSLWADPFSMDYYSTQTSPFGSSKTYGELQNLSADAFSAGKNLYMVEDHQAAFVDPECTSPTTQMWIQQQMSPFGSLKTYEQLQSLSAEPFLGENFYMVEDQATTFEDFWIQEQSTPFGSYKDCDFWAHFLV